MARSAKWLQRCLESILGPNISLAWLAVAFISFLPALALSTPPSLNPRPLKSLPTPTNPAFPDNTVVSPVHRPLCQGCRRQYLVRWKLQSPSNDRPSHSSTSVANSPCEGIVLEWSFLSLASRLPSILSCLDHRHVPYHTCN